MTDSRRHAVSIVVAAMCTCTVFVLTEAGRAECTDSGAAVRSNQAGFHADGAKLAVVVSSATRPVRWEISNRDGSTVATGQTRVFGDDPISGDHVHHAVFSDFDSDGAGFVLATDCARSHPFSVGDKPYGQLPYDALAYFYHNRSGIPIDANLAGGEAWARPAGHARDTASCRSGEDGHGNHWPGCDYSLDLTGGWYDAGDHGKYVVNGGISVWTLLNLYEWQRAFDRPDTFSDGQAAIPEAGNGVNDLLDEARWELEFLLRMQAPRGTNASVPVGIRRNRPGIEFTEIDASGMAHHKMGDENWTALPTPPHEDTERRVLYPVSTAATLNLAAVAAQCARIWRAIDEAFSARCLDAAQRAFAAAERHPDVYFIADFTGSGMYGDGELGDEFFWAAAELFATTAEKRYDDAMRASAWFTAAIESEHAWPDVAPLGLVSLAIVPSTLPDADRRRIRSGIVDAADRFAVERDEVGYHIPYADEDYRWGSNSNVLNRAMLLALAFEFTGRTGYRDAVIDSMDYLLGRNPLDRSYVAGYGERPMQYPHHRFWAPSFDYGLPVPPPGSLSGGPNSSMPADEVARELIDANCAPQTCWRDDWRAYSLNEVAINWNAPLVWVATFLDEPRP